jgi:hypothetical protein
MIANRSRGEIAALFVVLFTLPLFAREIVGGLPRAASVQCGAAVTLVE